jgi:hypothetical protein
MLRDERMPQVPGCSGFEQMIAKQRLQPLKRTWPVWNERRFVVSEPSVENQHVVVMSLLPSPLMPQLDDPPVLFTTLASHLSLSRWSAPESDRCRGCRSIPARRVLRAMAIVVLTRHEGTLPVVCQTALSRRIQRCCTVSDRLAQDALVFPFRSTSAPDVSSSAIRCSAFFFSRAASRAIWVSPIRSIIGTRASSASMSSRRCRV